jgi:hypothetical protein
LEKRYCVSVVRREGGYFALHAVVDAGAAAIVVDMSLFRSGVVMSDSAREMKLSAAVATDSGRYSSARVAAVVAGIGGVQTDFAACSRLREGVADPAVSAVYCACAQAHMPARVAASVDVVVVAASFETLPGLCFAEGAAAVNFRVYYVEVVCSWFQSYTYVRASAVSVFRYYVIFL